MRAPADLDDSRVIDVADKLESKDPAAFKQLRARAVDCAIRRLDELRALPGVEPALWERLFSDLPGDDDVDEIRQWRLEHAR